MRKNTWGQDRIWGKEKASIKTSLEKWVANLFILTFNLILFVTEPQSNIEQEDMA